MAPEIEIRMQRLAGHLHGLGPRAIHELLTEVATAHGLEADVLDRLERYGRLAPDTVADVGGDRFPPRPLMSVRS